ncbi:MAG: hypothetical protein PVTTEEND_001872 [Candidatus Fervidibacter sp.]|mgnify:CR=1 FL=1|jgi:hypothetical protein
MNDANNVSDEILTETAAMGEAGHQVLIGGENAAIDKWAWHWGAA